MRLAILFLFLSLAALAEARIGETSLQFVDRYGPPKDSPASKAADKSSPLIEGAIHHTYEYHGWRIRPRFLKYRDPPSAWSSKR